MLTPFSAIVVGATCFALAIVLRICASAVGSDAGRVLRNASWTQWLLGAATLVRYWHPSSSYGPLLALATLAYAATGWWWWEAAAALRGEPPLRKRLVGALMLVVTVSCLWGLVVPHQALRALALAYLVTALLYWLAAQRGQQRIDSIKLRLALRLTRACAYLAAVLVLVWGVVLAFAPGEFIAQLDDLAIASSLMGSLVLNVVSISAFILGVLVRMIATVETHALVDPLTGAVNRRGLDRHMSWLRRDEPEHEMGDLTRPGPIVAAITIDIDHFKRINDAHGHFAGDQVLIDCANRLRTQLRGRDVLARVGGEEFLAVVHDTDEQHAGDVAERLRVTIEREPFGLPDGQALPVTISLGWSLSRGDLADWRAVLHSADQALYTAKRAGRNRVVGAAQPPGATPSAATSPHARDTRARDAEAKAA